MGVKRDNNGSLMTRNHINEGHSNISEPVAKENTLCSDFSSQFPFLVMHFRRMTSGGYPTSCAKTIQPVDRSQNATSACLRGPNICKHMVRDQGCWEDDQA